MRISPRSISIACHTAGLRSVDAGPTTRDWRESMIALADAYLHAAAAAADLVENAAVARDWDKPSALADFSVRGLAGHLGTQVLVVPGLIGDPTPPTAEVLTLDQHYGRAIWRGADRSETVNVEIRDGGERHAAAGHEALVARVRAALADLPAILAGVDAQRSVYVPWNGWALAVNDFLTVRML